MEARRPFSRVVGWWNGHKEWEKVRVVGMFMEESAVALSVIGFVLAVTGRSTLSWCFTMAGAVLIWRAWVAMKESRVLLKQAFEREEIGKSMVQDQMHFESAKSGKVVEGVVCEETMSRVKDIMMEDVVSSEVDEEVKKFTEKMIDMFVELQLTAVEMAKRDMVEEANMIFQFSHVFLHIASGCRVTGV